MFVSNASNADVRSTIAALNFFTLGAQTHPTLFPPLVSFFVFVASFHLSLSFYSFSRPWRVSVASQTSHRPTTHVRGNCTRLSADDLPQFLRARLAISLSRMGTLRRFYVSVLPSRGRPIPDRDRSVFLSLSLCFSPILLPFYASLELRVIAEALYLFVASTPVCTPFRGTFGFAVSQRYSCPFTPFCLFSFLCFCFPVVSRYPAARR